MKILLQSATIIDPTSNYHNTTNAILIEDGIITQIAPNITPSPDTTVVEKENLHVSTGWIDSSVCFGEPGYEDRETIANGLTTAGKNGFSTVAVNANTNPVRDTNAGIGFFNYKTANHAVNTLAIGALTVKSEGVDLAELYDMQCAGALGFYDYQKPISNPNLLKLALQYTQNFNGLVFSFPQENKIAGKGVANEEKSATMLGLKGIPALAESLQVARDIYVLEYTKGRLHIPTISTAASVALIQQAKEKGLQISCSVAITNLFFDDSALESFDTNFKVLPPLRNKQDVAALRQGVLDGVIDYVTTDHHPIDTENKHVEFDHAMFGSIGLESAFGCLNTLFGTEKAIALLTKSSALFQLKNTTIAEGEKANLSLFNPDKTYTFSISDIDSSAKNSAFLDSKLQGQAYGIINNNHIILK